MTTITIYFFVALAASLALTPLCRSAAHRFGFVARPHEDRWHTHPTALFGGVAIVITALATGLTLGIPGPLAPLLVSAALIGAFGFVDDIMSLKPSTKLIAQIVVASVLLFFGFRLHWTESMVGDAMLTVFWIVGVTNAFNLLDNMDGLCAGTALIAGTVLLIGMVDGGRTTGAELYLAGLLGATAGFLAYNVHPASIFMGDTGSLFLGLNLASLTLLATPSSTGRSVLSVIAAPILPLLLPIFDTTLVTAGRLLSGRSPTQGGRDHTSHRLVAMGLSQPRAVATLWTIAAAGGSIALLAGRPDPGWGTIAAATFLLAMIIFGVYLARIRVYDDADVGKLTGQIVTPVVLNFMHKRRVAEVLLDVCLIPLAYYSAYRLRFEGSLLAPNYPFFIQSLPVVLGAQLMALFVVGGYRGTWRHFGMMDAVVFGKAVLFGTASAQVAILYLYRFENYSRSVFVIHAVVLLLLLAGSRASFRLVAEFVFRRLAVGKRCIIYGTGGASLATIREAFGSDVPLKIIGFVDDDPLQRNARVAGYPIVGGFSELVGIVGREEVDSVVLNTRLIDADRLRELEQACRRTEIDLLRLHVDLKPLSAAS